MYRHQDLPSEVETGEIEVADGSECGTVAEGGREEMERGRDGGRERGREREREGEREGEREERREGGRDMVKRTQQG